MALELRKRAIEFLKSRPDERYKASEIAEWIFQNYPCEAAAKKAASASIETDAQLLTQFASEIGAYRPHWEKKHPEFRTTDGVRPRQYYWTAKSEADEVLAIESIDKNSIVNAGLPKNRESDLYPKLVEYLKTELKVLGTRIDEKRSSNTVGFGGNKWLFPDVVGVENLTAGLNNDVLKVMHESGARLTRLWSFEVKLLINRANAREAYFQAVSNSCWANLGYLVAADIVGEDTLKEVRILYAIHGIGLIQLDATNPSESEILIPARERTELEWEMCSRLATENKDFKEFMTEVWKSLRTVR